MGISIDFDKIRTRISRHKVKNFANAYILPLSEEEQKALNKSDWRRAHEEFKKQQEAFHQKSNDKKNASLYVDIIDNKFLSPSDQITEDMVCEIADINKDFIELMRPKVEMLRYWVQYPEGTRESMKDLQKKMEKLKDKYPDDPSKACDVLFAEMLEQLKTVQQPHRNSLKTAHQK